MTKFTLSFETDESADIASIAVFIDLYINGETAKIQPFKIQQVIDNLISQLVEYTWSDRDWSEKEIKILRDTWEMLAKEAQGFRKDGPWSEDKEELANAH